MSYGIVRDNHYTDPAQYIDTILVNIPAYSGNSGSPIVDKNGDIVGIYTFGFTKNYNGTKVNLECLGGGANLDTLKSTIPVLTTSQNNKSKKYIGVSFYIPNPFELSMYYYTTTPTFDNKGLIAGIIGVNSPFYGFINNYDLLLSATLNYSNNTSSTVEFGALPGQYTLGVLLYTEAVSIEIRYLRPTFTTISILLVALNKTYANVPDSSDVYLYGGTSNETNDYTSNKTYTITTAATKDTYQLNKYVKQP